MNLDEKMDELVDRYLNGELSPEQSEEFEKLMSKDKAVRKLVEKRLMVDDFLFESPELEDVDFEEALENPRAKDYFNYYTNPENKKFYSSLKEIEVEEQVNNQDKKKMNWFNPRVAAVLLLLFASIFVFRLIGSKDSFQKYQHYQDLPSLTTKSQSEELLNEAEQAFEAEQFELASERFAEYKQNHGSLSDIASLYYSISLSENDQVQEAINQLEGVRNNDQSLVQAEAYWYSALFALKQKDEVSSKNFLTKYLEFPEAKYTDQAKELLSKMD